MNERDRKCSDSASLSIIGDSDSLSVSIIGDSDTASLSIIGDSDTLSRHFLTSEAFDFGTGHNYHAR